MLPKRKNFHILNQNNSTLLFDVSSNTIIRTTPSFSKFLLSNIEGKDEEYNKNEDILKQLNYIGLFNPNFNPLIQSYQSPIYKLSLEVFSGCNMRCLYCYANISKKVDQKPVKASFRKIKESLDFFVFDFGKEAKAYEVNIVGGGEPLLNFALIKKIRDYCEEIEKIVNKKIIFWIFTNGTVFTREIINYLIEKKQSLTISLDGPPEIQNYLRPFPNQKGSYEIIEKWIKIIKEQSKGKSGIENFWASTVITSKHKSLIDILILFNKLGIKKAQLRPIRTENIDLVFDKDELNKLRKLYIELINHLIGCALSLNFDLLKIILNDRDYLGRQIIRILKKEQIAFRCGAAKSKLSIRANGNIYPCDIGSDIKELKLGATDNFKIGNEAYFKLHVDKKDICKDCWARYLCGGGCYVTAHDRNSGIDTPDFVECEIMKIMIECAILFTYKVSNKSSVAIEKINRYIATQQKVLNKVYNL